MCKSKIRLQEFRIYVIKTIENFDKRMPNIEKRILWHNVLGKLSKLDISLIVTITSIKMYCYSSVFRPLHQKVI